MNGADYERLEDDAHLERERFADRVDAVRHKLRNQSTVKWVCLGDIAEWCARKEGDYETNDLARWSVYGDLAKSFCGGGALCDAPLRFLSENYDGYRIEGATIREQVKSWTNGGGDPERCALYSGYIANCWVPRQKMEEWLIGHKKSVPKFPMSLVAVVPVPVPSKIPAKLIRNKSAPDVDGMLATIPNAREALADVDLLPEKMPDQPAQARAWRALHVMYPDHQIAKSQTSARLTGRVNIWLAKQPRNIADRNKVGNSTIGRLLGRKR